MNLSPNSFNFSYDNVELVFGRGCVSRLGEKLSELNLDRALIVCGSNVGSNFDLMTPIKEGVGNKLVDTFDETSSNKKFGTVLVGAQKLEDGDIDSIISIGGGSSHDVARAMNLVYSDDRSDKEIVKHISNNGYFPTPNKSLLPIFTIPTTFAGADISTGGTIMLDTTNSNEILGSFGNRSIAHISDQRLIAHTLFYDPLLFATTPKSILTASAMNGFNKGIETIYSKKTNPISEAHAIHGLRHLRVGLPNLASSNTDLAAYDKVVVGMCLIQYGRKTNIIHIFGNCISNQFDVQQGVAHGIVTPHVLEYVFSQVDARRDIIAESLGNKTYDMSREEIAENIIKEVTTLRNELELPVQLREVKGLQKDDFDNLATDIISHWKNTRNPEGLSPNKQDIKGILHSSW